MSLTNAVTAVAIIALFCICVWVVILQCPKGQNVIMSNMQVNLIRHTLEVNRANVSRKLTNYKINEENSFPISGIIESTPLLIPKYMLELYKQSKRGSKRLNNQEQRRPDIVKAVTPTSTAVIFAGVYNKKVMKKHLFVFEIPQSNFGEILEAAELRVFADMEPQQNNKDDLHNRTFLDVLLVKENAEEMSKLDSCTLFQNKEKWVSFNVTAAFQLMEMSVLALLVNAESVVNIQLKSENGNKKDYEPLLILSYNSMKITDDIHKRNRRSVEEYEEETNKIWNNDNILQKMPSQHTKRYKNTCRRRPLYVDFSQINYDTWIVAPEGYEESEEEMVQSVKLEETERKL